MGELPERSTGERLRLFRYKRTPRELLGAAPVSALDAHMRLKRLSCVALAELCGVTQQAVSHWRLGERAPSAVYAKLLAKTLEMPLHLLRPDLWDPPEPAEPSLDSDLDERRLHPLASPPRAA
jgi:transcriptional regulator with XRE-family HTH domain